MSESGLQLPLLALLLALPAGAGARACETVHNTTCAAGSSCAKSSFSATGWGCCPLPNAVDCGTPLGSCCPAGTKCSAVGPGWEKVVSCLPAAAGKPPVPGTPVCKPGPLNRLSTTRKNCLVLGDSVSLGYTPFLTTALADDCVVQHAPDGGDGGAEETGYGLEGLDSFLSNPDGAPLSPDLILFNFVRTSCSAASPPLCSSPSSDPAALAAGRGYTTARATGPTRPSPGARGPPPSTRAS